MNKFVIINEELRLGDVNDFPELIGENTDEEVKSKGSWKIFKAAKQIFFYGDLTNEDFTALRTVKNSGFYSPTIQDHQWYFAESDDPNQYVVII